MTMKTFKGPRRQRGFIQIPLAAASSGGLLGGLGKMFSGGLGNLASGLFGALGAKAADKAIKRGRTDVLGLPGMSGPAGLSGNFGSSFDGRFQLSPELLAAQSGIQQQLPNLFGGGLFNNPSLQAALQGNDIAGALSQSNAALQSQMGPQAFGGLGQLFGNVSGLANQFGSELAGTNFGDVEAQQLANLRSAVEPEQNRLFNKLQDRLFATGQLGSTGGGEQMRGLFEAFGQQDRNLMNDAFGRAQAQRAQGLQGFQGLSGLASGLEGQGFNQMLQALGQNQSAGMNRVNQALGLLGGAQDIFGQNFGLGLQGAGGMLDFGQFGLDASSLPFQLQAQLLQGSGEHANALTELAGMRAQSSGGLFGGIGKALGGLFG